MDICKFKGTSYYRFIIDALKSGNFKLQLEDFTIKEVPVEEYFSGDITYNGELLSKDDKASLLNSVQHDLEERHTLTPEISQRIEELRTVLDLSKEAIIKAKSVVVPSLEIYKLNQFKIPSSKSYKLLDILEEKSKMIPILNLDLNNYVVSAVLSSLKEVCLWNEETKIIVADNRELTESILMYRNSLVQILNNFVGANVTLPIGSLSNLDVEDYNKLMLASWDSIKNILYRFNGEINIAYDENTASTIINPIMAFYVLLNFDSVLSTFLSDFITINPSEVGNINASNEKYKKKSSKRLQSSYNDTINDSDGNNLVDSILDTFITSTKKENGMYLDKKFKENMLCVIRDAVENKAVKRTEFETEKELVDSLAFILSNVRSNADAGVQALIDVLASTNSITEKLGLDSCKKLADRLQSFLEAVNKKKSISSSKQYATIDNEYNVGYKLLNYIANIGVVGITSISGATSTSSITPGTKEKSKEYVKTKLVEALVDTLGSNKRLLTSKSPLIVGNVSAEGITDLYSENAQDVLTQITGLNFRDPIIVDKFSTDLNLQKLANFIKVYRETVLNLYEKEAGNIINDRKGVAARIVKEILKTGAYIDFSDILVLENEFELLRMFDLQLKEQARTTVATLSTLFTLCFSDFKNYMGSHPNRNILVRFPGNVKLTLTSFDSNDVLEKTSKFSLYITFLGDCKFKDGSIARWVKLRPNEINSAYINLLYLFNAIENDMISFQIDVTSDKVKTPLANINLKNRVLAVNFIRQNLQTLQQIKQDQLQDYYSKIKELIFDFFEKILGTRYNTLIELDNAILKKSVSDIMDAVRIEQERGNFNFNFLPEIFFSTNKSGKLQLNRCLCYEIFKSENLNLLKEYDGLVFEHYKQTLIDLGIKLTLEASYIDSLDYDQKLNLVSMFFDNPGSSVEAIDGACNKIKEIIKKDPTFNNKELDYYLHKFITLQNIVRESAILVFNKHYWVHGESKESVDLITLSTIADLKVDALKAELHRSALLELMSKEMKKRIEKSTKRNNSQSATFAPMDQGLKHGVPLVIRIAALESLLTPVTNNFGNKDTLYAHDGAIFSAYILRIWERNSQVKMYMADSSKIIALLPTDAGFYLIKCADYAMTNEWIRNTINKKDSNSNQFVDGKYLYKLMLSPAKTDILLSLMDKDAMPLYNLGLGLGKYNFNVFYNFLGIKASLTDIYIDHDENGKITLVPTWELQDGGAVENDVVAQTLGLKYDGYSNGLYIKDVYDLWNFFGGELSESVKEDGTINYSDISQEYVAYLIDEYAPDLKSTIISKLCDPLSVKATPFPINSRDDIYNKNKSLVSVNFNTRYYGPQQDYSHETDEDTIPFTTLVIGAIAFNGENSEMVLDLYETIGEITAEALSEITDLANNTNKTALYKKIGKLVANNLASNGVISNAVSILEDSLKALVNDNGVFAKKALPLSDNQLYHAATSQILSKLNKIIKLRFTGTAVVLNPSLGIRSVYSDSNGVIYSKSKIIKKALDWYKELEERTGLFATEDIVDAYLNRESTEGDLNNFRNKAVFGEYIDAEGNPQLLNDLYQLNIGDNVQVIIDRSKIKDSHPELYNALKEVYGDPFTFDLEISDPIILYLLADAANYNNISEKERYIKGILKVFNRPRNLATTQITFLDETGKYTNLWLLKSTQAAIADTSKGITEAKWWHHENLKGLGDKENPYYYATLKDFKDKKPTKILKNTIVFKGGEEALPKLFKRKYSINGEMSDILEANEEYFERLIRQRIKADPNINLSAYGIDSFVISTNDYDIVFADPSVQVNKNVTLEQTGQYYRLYTDNDELIPNIKLPLNYTYSVQYVSGNGKPQLVIVPNVSVSHNNDFIISLLKNIPANSARFALDRASYAEELAALDENLISEWKIKKLALLLFTSFKLTLKTVSVRIPSQSYQSFLPNETVLFNEGDENNGYMNIWEMWFLGSDFDIDKAYTIMFEPGELGIIEGNVFSDYSSADKLLESFLIRNPNKGLRLWRAESVTLEYNSYDVTNLLLKYLRENKGYDYVLINKLLDDLKKSLIDKQNSGNEIRTLIYQAYDGLAIDNTGQLISAERYYDLANKLNAYNLSEQNDVYKRNKAMAGIRYASQDIHNLRASLMPMESKSVNASIDESLKRNNEEDAGLIYFNDDPGHIAHFLYQNSIGKEGVGISANGIKVLSAVLQNTNNKIRNEKLEPMIDPVSGEIGISLEFKLNKYDSTRILRERVLKIPNTPMTRDLFERFYGPYQLLLPLYDLFRKLLKKDFDQLFRVHTGDLNDKEKNFLKIYLLLSSEQYLPTFLETLYYVELFEQNTADVMSIFISLCTDNAKELSLFKIGATPDLLNLPLAMITLGMEIQDVTDICVLYIVPLMKELNVNRYYTTEEADIKTVINNHIKTAPDDLKNTYKSLLKIYETAQEMKVIARLFKVNLGVSVITTDVQSFLNSLNLQMADPEHVKDSKKIKTYDDFFGHNGDEAIAEAVENYKATAINIVDIITGSSNFFKLLEACYKFLGIIENTITVSHLNAVITKKLLGDKVKIKNSQSKVVQQTVLNALLSSALQSLPSITFEKSDTEKFGEWNSDLANNALVGVSTKMKVDNLLLFIENAFVPYLQKNYDQNFFVLLLKKGTKGRYELPFDSFGSKGDLRTKMDVTKATIAFSLISSIATGIHTLDGIDITFGDLMYLYAIITNLNRVNALLTIVKEATAKTSKLNIAEKIDNYYANLDRLVSISTTEFDINWNDEDKNTYDYANRTMDSLIQKIYPYAKAAIQKSSVDVTNANGIKINYTILEDYPLFTMIPGELKIDVGGTYVDLPEWKDKAVNTLLTLLSGYNSSAKINKDSIALNGEILTFTVSLPMLMGKLERERLVIVSGIKNGVISVSNYKNAAVEISKAVATLSESLSNIAEEGTLVSGKSVIDIISSYVSDKNLEKALKIIGYDDSLRTIPTLALNFYNWAISKKDANNNPLQTLIITGSKYIKSHIDKLGTTPILMINPNDFSGKSLDIAYTLMNLFLDKNIEPSTIPTPLRRLVLLLVSLTGNNDITVENLTTYLSSKEIQEHIRNSQAASNWYQGYLDDTTDSQLKETAWNNVGKFTKALSIADSKGSLLYYYSCDDSLDNELGDIFLDESGEKFIYVGDTDDNLMILRNVDVTSVESVRLTYKAAAEMHTYKRIAKLRINSDYSTNKLAPTKLEYGLYKVVNTLDIRQGDIVTVDGVDYYISAVLYEKLPNNKYNTVLLGSSDGEVLQEIASQKFVLVKRILSDIDVNGEPEFTILDLPKGDMPIKETLVSKMSYGNVFKYYDILGEINTGRFKSYSRGFITTIDQKLIPIDALHSVSNFDLILLYPKLHIDTIGLSLKVPNKESIASIIYGRPEFKYGYIWHPGDKGSGTITPRYVFNLSSEHPLFFIPFNLNNDLKYRGIVDKDVKLEKNDTVLVQELTKDQGTIAVNKYVILDQLGDSLVVLKSEQVNPGEAYYENGLLRGIDRATVKHSVVTISRNTLDGGKLYKDERKKGNIRLFETSLVITNAYDKVYELMAYLSKRFNTPILLVENKEDASVFAKVKNGVIEINMAKKPEELDPVHYILERGIHEFMHLAITALKSESPAVYLLLLLEAEMLPIVKDKRFYNGDILEKEETLVRYLTDNLMGNIEESGISIKDSDIEEKMLNAIRDLLKIEYLSSEDLKKSLESLLKQSSLFLLDTLISQEEMLGKALKDEYIEKIKYICN